MAPDLARILLGALFCAGCGGTALAAGTGDGDAPQVKPLLDARLRFETVAQPGLDADALTVRLRAGAELVHGHFSLLAEAEGNAALADDYNAFPFALPGARQWRPAHAVVADPMNVELNRLQLQYKAGRTALTVGRQRINLDDQRWVGSVGWRQNEQTFDAVRGEAGIGPVTADVTWAISQRTIFGIDGGPRTALDGHFVFAGLSASAGPVQGKLFAYLLDYDAAFYAANSSQTYGLTLSTVIPVAAKTGISLRASHARQSDYAGNPFDYAARYWSLDASAPLAGFTLSGGWETLGSDRGRGLQTPMATLHKFNGWADLFLTTPAGGLQDGYVMLSRKFGRVRALPGLTATVAFHQFDSDAGNVEYGTEWDASLGFRLHGVALLAKFADYRARDFGVDTRKFWLQAEWAF